MDLQNVKYWSFWRFVVVCCLSLLVLSLAACGGGSGKAKTPIASTSGIDQAILGPLAGAQIRAYALSNLTTPIESTIASDNSTDLQKAGSFSLKLSGVADNQWVLVTATGGKDVDAKDTGNVASTSVPNAGTIHAIASAAAWRAGGQYINVITELAWQEVKTEVQSGKTAGLTKDLNWVANQLIARDLNGDGTIDYKDLTAFVPYKASFKTKLTFPYTKLFTANSQGYSLIDYIQEGDEQGEVSSIAENFGSNLTPPLVPKLVDITPKIILPTNSAGLTSSQLSISSFGSSTPQVINTDQPTLLPD